MQLIQTPNWVQVVFVIRTTQVNVLVIGIYHLKLCGSSRLLLALFLLTLSEEWAYGDFEQVAEHVLQQGVLLVVLVAQERIVVDLEKPGPEVFVDQEVVTEKLPAKLSLFLIDLMLDGKDGVNGDVLHGRKHVLLDIDVL